MAAFEAETQGTLSGSGENLPRLLHSMMHVGSILVGGCIQIIEFSIMVLKFLYIELASNTQTRLLLPRNDTMLSQNQNQHQIPYPIFKQFSHE
jgi:hypothetical protein